MAWKRPTVLQLGRSCGALVLVALIIALAGYVLVRLATLSMAVFAAAIITAILSPLERALERWRIPPSLASLLPLLVTVALLASTFVWVLPRAAAEVSQHQQQLASSIDAAWRNLRDRLPEGWSDVENLTPALTSFLQRHGRQILSGLFSGLMGLAEGFTGLLLAIVLSFFFLKDGRALTTCVLAQLRTEARQVFAPAADRAWSTLQGWVKGAAVVALVDALAIGIGLLILGVPLAFSLALLTFLASFIPVVGAMLAGGLAVLVAWAGGGTTDALITLGIVLGVQQLEGNVLQPMLIGHSVPLHPAAILMAVTAGALLGGVAGAFAAVPLTAMGVAFIQEVYNRSEPPDEEEAPPQVSMPELGAHGRPGAEHPI